MLPSSRSRNGPDARFRVGEWLVEPMLNRLSRGEETSHVEPRVMDLLAYLASRRGGVASNEELLDGVWGKPFLAQSVLTRAMTLLRRALGDDARHPTYIETIPRRGYRLIAAVEGLDQSSADRAAPFVEAAGRDDVETGWCVLLWKRREFVLAPGEHVIGRDGDAGVRLPTARVSRRHARLVVSDGHVRIEDLGSKNGTVVRGKRLRGTTEIDDGDEIIVGGEVLTLRLLVPSGSTVTDGSS